MRDMINTGFPNLKNRNRRYIVWGIDKDTGEERHIDDVENGRLCNCRCPLCGEPLMARQGENRMHHFAHEHNRDCCYDEEMWCYYTVKKILSNNEKLHVTDPKTNNGRIINFDKDHIVLDLEDQTVFPPPLYLNVKNGNTMKRLYIVLDTPNLFDDGYFLDNEEYRDRFHDFALNAGNAFMSIKLDKKWLDKKTSAAEREKCIIEELNNKEWIWNERNRYQTLNFLVKKQKPNKIKVKRSDWNNGEYCWVNFVECRDAEDNKIILYGYMSNRPDRNDRFITRADEEIWEVLKVDKTQKAWKE